MPNNTDEKRTLLSKDEKRLMELVARGFTDDEIAAEFKIPKGQVLLRIPQLLAKIGVQERLEMVFYAYTDVGVYQQMSPQVQKHFNSPPIKQRAS